MYFRSGLEVKDIIQQLNQPDGPCLNFQLRKGPAFRSSNNVMVHTLNCQRGRVFKQATKDDNKKHRKTNTSFPVTEEERCRFHIKLYEDQNSNQCFLRRSSGFCWSHNNHPAVSRELQEDRVANIPEEPLYIARELLKKLVPPSTVVKYLNVESGLSLSTSAIEWLRNTVIRSKHGTTMDETSAQKLIKLLDNTEGMHYVTLTGQCALRLCTLIFSNKSTNSSHFHSFEIFETFVLVLGSYDEASKKVKVRKKNRQSDVLKTESELKDIDESSNKFIKSIIDGLDLGTGEFLIAVCWVTANARRYHQLYPSVLGLDVVFGTNAEQRPQLRGTGISSSNKNLPIVDALLPNQSKWIFNWFVNDALPSTLDNVALRKTKIILTDQDRELMSAIDQTLR